ncbi:MAG: glutamate-5-semialdehyde dehydrogenase [Armatimonadota bacterium]|nr:MAG: glutamate-5-semialdehyde dehydrogenase [Armatimonadota bacterium]
MEEVVQKAQRAKAAAARLATLSRAEKDRILLAMADAIEDRAGFILEANARDVQQAQNRKLSSAPIDRLMLDEKRITAMAQGLRTVAGLADPVGEVIGGWRLPNGLEITKVRVPLGVIGIIYESRPNVTVDAAGLCLKAGNAVVLRGGSDAINSNTALGHVLTEAGLPEGLPEGAVEIIETIDREAAVQLMRLTDYLDVLIPRGGGALIRRVKEESTVPVIETGEGNCHVYVDASADLAAAEEIVVNAKCQRPGVCNAAETLLVHRDVARQFLPRVGRRLVELGVELRACDRSRQHLEQAKPAVEEDWATEYLGLSLAVKVVDDAAEAIAHINRYGTKHSEAILTEDLANARRFTREVDAAVVYVNASTRFTDGEQFGMGAEIGISNQKLHARGPMGLAELTSYKYVVTGEGHVRA